MAKAKPKAEGTKTLLVADKKGNFKTEVPIDAKITFGPAYPTAKGDGNYGEKEYALRVYVGNEKNLLAVFTGVRYFRVDTVPVWREVIREAGKTVWKSDEQGYKVESEVKRDKRLELEGAVDELTATESVRF